MDPVYCWNCRAANAANIGTCPHCGAVQSREAAEAAEAERARKEAAQRAAKEWRGADLSALTPGEQARYLKVTGRGTCPACRSANVSYIKLREGGKPLALPISIALAGLGFFFIGPFCFFIFGGPIAAFGLGVVMPGALLIAGALMSGNSFPANRCNYCGNRWRI